jgi:membrane fusion protein (multidrug efflux system)
MRTRHVSARITTLSAGWVLVAVGLTGCGGRDDSTQSPATRAAAPQIIEVTRVIQQPVDVTLSMPGQLEPYQTVAIYPKITAFVKAIRVDRGSRVRAGELIAELEAPELVAQRAEAQSKLQAAEAQLAVAQSKAEADTSTFDRLEAASATPGVVAGNDLVLAQKAVEVDQNQITAAQQSAEAARQALQAVVQMEGYLRVAAPFSGIVTERNVHPGALVGSNSGPTAATPMVRLVQNNRLRLVVPVPEAYVAGVRDSVTISFTVAAYPGRAFAGRIARIAHDVDVKTRTMAVELDVINTDGSLVAGAFCQVAWPVHRPEPSLFVPAGSIASTTDRTFVVRVRNGNTEWVDVRTGLSSGPLTEVFGDLRPGDAVATRGTDEIRPGTAVRAQEAKAAT